MSEAASNAREGLGVVAIGRNEGDRLRACLESVVGRAAVVVYVDSGSTDGSVDLARALGAEVVELDMASPFTAARARNAGIWRLTELLPEIAFIQVVDGDCEIVDGWLEGALDEIRADDNLAIVCGRRREGRPEASAYSRLCDMEWDTPIGEATACGGDALVRRTAFFDVGGYDGTIIAGEEPELCFRLREKGWKIRRIDREMTLHDAQMTRLSQWWRRAVRNGHAFAEGRDLHGDGAERYRVKEVRSILEWAVLLPVLALALAWFTWGLSLLLFGGYILLWYRVRNARLKRGDGAANASIYARYCVLGKFPEALGVARYWIDRLLGRAPTIIEYKNEVDEVASREAPEVSEA